jgi:DNA adenine methylase
MNKRLKTPISYYGGKQKLASLIISLFPENFKQNFDLYGEPFFGGGAVFFQKDPSEIEVINDVNHDLINFFTVLQTDFEGLKQEIMGTFHNRELHRRAQVILNNPDMFDRVKRAWAIWVLSSQSFSSKLNGSWGYEVTKNQMPKKIASKKAQLTTEYSERLKNVQIESTDALRIIKSRDSQRAFFYCDPPYYNSDCGHYNGYSLEDFKNLLMVLSQLKGKFLLSSYPSPLLEEFKERFGWEQIQIKQSISVGVHRGKRPNIKTEVLTANYPITKKHLFDAV